MNPRHFPTYSQLIVRIAFFLLFFSFGHKTFAQSLTEKISLDNGVNVLYTMDTTRPLMEVSLSVRGGARIDGPGADGVAALLSRTFWERGQDSSRYIDFAQRLGIQCASRQGLSHSQFHMRMLPGRLAKGLDLLRFALEEADYSKTDLEKSLQQYALFLQRRESDPFAYLEEQVGQTLWQDQYPEMNLHGQYIDLYGPKSATYRDLHRVYLHPGNALLTATGPLPSQQFFALADSILGVWNNFGPRPYLPYNGLPQLENSAYEIHLNERTRVPQIRMVWPLEGTYRDSSVVSLAEWFVDLAQSSKSPFVSQLVQPDLATNLRWEYIPTRGPGQLSLTLIPDLERLPECLAGIEASLRSMANAGVDWEESALLTQRSLRMQAALFNDEPINELFYQSRIWAIGLDPVTHGNETITQEQISGFVDQYLLGKPHVAGLLMNSTMSSLDDFEGLFQPTTPILVAQTELPVDTPVAPPPPPPPPSYEWLKDIKVYFEPSSFTPDSASVVNLTRVVVMLQGDDSLRVFVNGFTDGQGDGVSNYLLSIQRAESIRDYIHERYGILLERLLAQGFGEAFAEYPDDTPEHRALNRRVTFELVPPDYVPDAY